MVSPEGTDPSLSDWKSDELPLFYGDMAQIIGFEPTTSSVTVRCTNQLCYICILKLDGDLGIEPKLSGPKPDVLPLDESPKYKVKNNFLLPNMNSHITLFKEPKRLPNHFAWCRVSVMESIEVDNSLTYLNLPTQPPNQNIVFNLQFRKRVSHE